MKIRIKYLGLIADKTGVEEEILDVEEGKSNIEIEALLLKKYQQISTSKYSIAINHTISTDVLILKDGDELAILPPFAGG